MMNVLRFTETKLSFDKFSSDSGLNEMCPQTSAACDRGYFQEEAPTGAGAVTGSGAQAARTLSSPVRAEAQQASPCHLPALFSTWLPHMEGQGARRAAEQPGEPGQPAATSQPCLLWLQNPAEEAGVQPASSISSPLRVSTSPICSYLSTSSRKRLQIREQWTDFQIQIPHFNIHILYISYPAESGRKYKWVSQSWNRVSPPSAPAFCPRDAPGQPVAEARGLAGKREAHLLFCFFN